MTSSLAVDTVTGAGSVVLAVDGETVAQHTFSHRQHAARLLPGIMMCLADASLTPGEIDEVIVADGPGSFTGIRIGFATVSGFVSELSPRLLVASSLTATALANAGEGGPPAVAMYDALRGEVYAACYRRTAAGFETVYEPHRSTVATLMARKDETPGTVVGDGALVYREEVERWIGSQPSEEPPHARNLLMLRELPGALLEVSSLSDYNPNYGRLAEAQVRWERRHGRRLPDSTGTV